MEGNTAVAQNEFDPSTQNYQERKNYRGNKPYNVSINNL